MGRQQGIEHESVGRRFPRWQTLSAVALTHHAGPTAGTPPEAHAAEGRTLGGEPL